MILCLQLEVSGQGYVDNALLFSRTQPGGSARIQGLGGAQTALGGDYSSALSNPAGLGMFNRSEFAFSLGLNNFNSSSTYLDNTEDHSKSTFNIPGFGLVFHQPRERESGFLGGSFAISLSRTNDLNSVLRYSGSNSATSIIDFFMDDASGAAVYDTLGLPTLNFDFPTGLAYDNYLIQDSAFIKDPFNAGDLTEYFSVLGTYPDLEDDVRRVSRRENNSVKGAQYQWSFSYGANFSDKFYVGAGLGVTTVRYEYKRIYNESDFSFDLDPEYNPLENLELEENISIRGTGVNFTVGMIYRPVDFIQLGASLVTPTYYRFDDTYSAAIRTQWNNFEYLDGERLNDESAETRQPIVSEYRLSTPLKFNAGATFFISKYGFITADAEFIDYSKAKYRSDLPFDAENDDIKYYFQNVVNYRIGAEFRYDMFRVRAGYGLQSNPYKDAFDVDRKIQSFTGGAGIRWEKFYIDLAIVHSRWDTSYSPYIFRDGSGPIVELQNKSTNGVITLGFTY
jgi:long-subunit fatty acid transport protein